MLRAFGTCTRVSLQHWLGRKGALVFHLSKMNKDPFSLSEHPHGVVYFFVQTLYGVAQNLKGLSQDVVRVYFAKNIRASPFTKDLSNKTTFS